MPAGFYVTLPLFFVGFIGMWIILAKNGALGMDAFYKLGILFRERKRHARIFVVCLLVTIVGGGGSCISIMAQDARANGECRRRCEDAGFADGIIRGNPHAERPGETPRECWCQNAGEWADESLGPVGPGRDAPASRGLEPPRADGGS
ncbi:MAG TPA: hypothetical protein RMH85_22765 [Polyangiaceae bacterium LLY-WYZ-15_(1-7)]|nr:hypothetical protein [Myxococcales bacterium]MAT27556.1 hypothetical protein [Sandaracinus sp.]HJL06386.1 hypothetical protein [Polyangiaceae bacterium LLY-WYZ-15_(1-7)]MBJ74132.1 hypothetical protein [Sandaracinus sp.]HJL11315.1 hypothetical protein [Polyangiaceae bacterium LLY-WYZ-15_(1-7)]